MTSLRFDDGGCAAMTPAACEAFRASPVSCRRHAAQDGRLGWPDEIRR
jgi:hypothetical protein